MLELLIAATDRTDFTFNAQTLAQAALVQWPDARIIEPSGPLAGMAQLFIEIPDLDNAHGPELNVLPTAEGIALEAPSRESAARVMAWIAQVCDLPTDGSVVVIHWTNDFYPLLPAVTFEILMRDVER
jgi:hypothetical protein